mmetsp:Transcript_38172/g.104031  ORF Transcript_38172/g.104031 Transcript_38172/m.104031 type:complete len:155 (-) Transcript_38172:4-468(-)
MGIVIDSPNLANMGVDIDFYDDAEGLYWEANRNSTACLADDSVSDCFSWDDDAGYFSGRWAWGGCCTDGWGFGPLPETGFDFNVKSVDAGEYKTYGMDWALFGTWNETSQSLDFLNLTMGQLYDGVQVTGYTCPDYCALFTDCGPCEAETEACG